MSRLTLRIVIILAGLSIAGITFTQIYWVRKAFDIRENQFYLDVDESLRDVAERIFEINKTPSPVNNPVTQVSTNYYVVTINGPIDASLLEFLIATEFEKRNIKAEFEYGVYDCIYKCMAQNQSLPTPGKTRLVSEASLPHWEDAPPDGYYFGVRFPQLEANLISQMGIWLFSSAVNLVVIFFFVYTMFVILKQRRLSEIQRDFINNMTHEFKTPISTIAISAEVLKDPSIVNTPERLLNYSTIIQNENNRLKQQVERVLQMARLDKEEIKLKKEVLCVHEIIQEAVKNISINKSVNSEIELNLNSTHSNVHADKLHLTNVFFNLLDNALKYCKETPKITISTTKLNDLLHITVKDNGIGISPENHRKVFQKFFRVSTGNIHDVKGFGIGLNYVKLVMESHKGRINLASELGKGSTFTLILPVA